ncbi:hypothetical protein GTY81_19840 [Streptomyces sp. SID8366]|uniref:hypothetical protein n=1 Tax=unclassified Streptomyces TaxID=2593676 RepID=UPI000DBA2CD2|nr:hypothetical protein [Streptomyces sp. PsTaAH-130]MYU06088.1 hypothetical protein [Streptomyces sp. SID8366]MYU68048.1 hypothetical protein [Streptomyces sp. SID69]
MQEAGVDFAEVTDTPEGNGEKAVLMDLARQVEEDRDASAQLMADLGMPVNRTEVALGWVAEKAGRPKTDSHLFSHSPLSDVLEAEAMLWASRSRQRAGAPRAPGPTPTGAWTQRSWTPCWNAPSARARPWRRCGSRQPPARCPDRVQQLIAPATIPR